MFVRSPMTANPNSGVIFSGSSPERFRIADWGAYASRVWVVASRDDELSECEAREGETPSPTPETGVLPGTEIGRASRRERLGESAVGGATDTTRDPRQPTR